MEWKIVVDTACDFREIPNKAENVTYERVPGFMILYQVF